MKIPTRILNRAYAFINGYFWLPCPICGEMFGGHEVNGGGLMTDWDRGWTRGKCVCVKCVSIAHERNMDFMANNPLPPIVAPPDMNDKNEYRREYK